MLEARGSGLRWREWIAMLLHTSASRVLINGQQTDDILHRKVYGRATLIPVPIYPGNEPTSTADDVIGHRL